MKIPSLKKDICAFGGNTFVLHMKTQMCVKSVCASWIAKKVDNSIYKFIVFQFEIHASLSYFEIMELRFCKVGLSLLSAGFTLYSANNAKGQCMPGGGWSDFEFLQFLCFSMWQQGHWHTCGLGSIHYNGGNPCDSNANALQTVSLSLQWQQSSQYDCGHTLAHLSSPYVLGGIFLWQQYSLRLVWISTFQDLP